MDFMTIRNTKEFNNIAGYIVKNSLVDYNDDTSENRLWCYKGMRYTEWSNGNKEIVIDDTVTTLHTDGTLTYWEM